MPEDTPKEERCVTFEYPIPGHLMAIDGTRKRACTLRDVSENGATLVVEGSVEDLGLKEFFLLLSSTGLVYRRCELLRMNGDQMTVRFLRRSKKQPNSREPSEFL